MPVTSKKRRLLTDDPTTILTTYFIMNKRKFNELLRASFKSDDTEEWLDIHFNRPMGLLVALAAERLHITPNAITIFSFFLGAAAGWMFYYTDLAHNLLGVLLLTLANFCDSADGQLARMTNQRSLLGRALDGFSSDVWFTCIYFAIFLRIFDDPIPFIGVRWGLWGLALVFCAGVFGHTPQCRLADYYRQIHLFFLLGKAGSELDDSASQRAIVKALPKEKWFDRFYYTLYGNYCAAQEKDTPNFQVFYRNIQQHYPNAADIPQELRDEVRARSLPLMKYTNMLTHNLRAITLFVGCLAGVPYLYPVVELTVMPLMYLKMHRTHERMCRELNHKWFEA